MPYEIEFHPVGRGQNSGDAITLRYHDGTDWRVMVIDGGYQENGPLLCEHIRTYYQTSAIDDVVSTHPDDDHIGGLATVLEQMTVKRLWIHRPDQHAGEIVGLFSDSRWTATGLALRLRNTFSAVEALVQQAKSMNTPVLEPFQGNLIGPFRVLSPTRKLYNLLVPQFRSTPDEDLEFLRLNGLLLRGVGTRRSGPIFMTATETWESETLREGGITSAENESSLVLHGNLGNGPILLTADAGTLALSNSLSFAAALPASLGRSLRIFQVPHHGSRNNVSPTLLTYLLGPALRAGELPRSGAVVTVGIDDTTHPRQVVINAVLRRGLVTHQTRRGILRYCDGMPDRRGWGPVEGIPFSTKVEEYR